MRFIFLSVKKNIIPFFLILLVISLVAFSKTNLAAAKSGLSLWANNVVPSLFPFFVVTELLSHTNIIYWVGKFFDKIMRPLFSVPGECAFAFIMGLISGYPTGAKIVASLREQNLCTQEEGERMLAFTNNSGPLFIISYVGISLFGDTKTGLLLLCTHILASITVGIILGRFFAKKRKNTPLPSTTPLQTVDTKKEPLSFKNFGKVLGESIQNATSTILLIGGFVVMFSVFISILNQSHILDYLSHFVFSLLSVLGFPYDFAKPVLSGMLELTTGLQMVSKISIKTISQNVILCAFLLGFGGISVLFQVYSMVSHTDLSIKKYVLGKLLQGIIAAFYTFLSLTLFPFLSLDIQSVSAPIASRISYPLQTFRNQFFYMSTSYFTMHYLFCLY